MELRKRELAEGVAHVPWREIERQVLQIEAFFADVALRLLIDRPKDAPDGDAWYWQAVADDVARKVRDCPDIVRRLTNDRVIEFRENESRIREILSDVGQAIVGRLFLYRRPDSRDMVSDLISRVAPTWIEALGELLSLSSQLRLTSDLISVHEGNPTIRETLIEHANLLRSSIRELQRDPYQTDGDGRDNIDWSIPMLENNVVIGAFRSMVSNRARTALRTLLVQSGQDDRSVRGQLQVHEFDSDDWEELRQDLGLEDIGPIKQLIVSPRGAELLSLAKAKCSREEALQRDQTMQAIMVDVLGPRADLNLEVSVSVLRALERRLDRFNHGWTQWRRANSTVSWEEIERRRRELRAGTAEDAYETDLGSSVDARRPSTGLESSRSELASPDASGDVALPDGQSSAHDDFDWEPSAETLRDPLELEPEAGQGVWSNDTPYRSPFDCGAESPDMDAAALALRPLSCATQVLVFLRLSELAYVPVDGGKQRKEKEIVYAAAISVLYRLHSRRGDLGEAVESLCKFLCEIGDQSPATKGFLAYCSNGELGPPLKDIVETLAQAWQEDGVDPLGSLVEFELKHQGRVALSPSDRRKLQKLFERAKLECTVFDSDQVHLRNLFA